MKHLLQSKSPCALSKGFSTLCLFVVFGCSRPSTGQSVASGSDAEPGKKVAAPAAADDKPVALEKHSQEDKSSPSTDSSATSVGEETQMESKEVTRALPPGEPCGPYTCYRLDRSEDALVPLILEKGVRVIAFGEAHAPADYSGRSTVKRFTDELLPKISGGSSHLLVELLQPPASGCEREKKVAEAESKEITKGQAESNQNEYLALGLAAHKLGVVPDILHASCDDLARIASPEGGVVAMMESIARLSEQALKKDLRSVKKGRPLVLAYGGALHNDAVPRPGRETWSYGPELLEASGGAFIEVDLIVPELIRDSESWKSFVWYDVYKALNHKEGALLLKWGEHSYVLFFAPDKGPVAQ